MSLLAQLRDSLAGGNGDLTRHLIKEAGTMATNHYVDLRAERDRYRHALEAIRRLPIGDGFTEAALSLVDGALEAK